MADFIVGKWKGSHKDVENSKEYFAASKVTEDKAGKQFWPEIGKPEALKDYITEYNVVITKTGDQQYKNEMFLGDSTTPLLDYINIGGKCQQLFHGFGLIEADCSLEGNKIVNRAKAEGFDIKTVRYVEGDTLVMATSVAGVTTVARVHRV